MVPENPFSREDLILYNCLQGNLLTRLRQVLRGGLDDHLEDSGEVRSAKRQMRRLEAKTGFRIEDPRCDACGFRPSRGRKELLMSHISNVHFNFSPLLSYDCDFCRQKLSSVYRLEVKLASY